MACCMQRGHYKAHYKATGRIFFSPSENVSSCDHILVISSIENGSIQQTEGYVHIAHRR